MKMNLYNYLSTINRLWNNEDGVGVARFITLSGNHAKNPNLHTDKPDEPVSRAIEPPLDEVVSFHLKVLYNLHSEREF
jgi:nuclear mRNA export protein PCID2/THP1